MGRVCECCGSDTYKAEHFDDVRDRANREARAADRVASENGVLRLRLRMAEETHIEAQAGLQRKIARQARVIRRLEERLRERGDAPHPGVTPDHTSPVQQA